MRSPSTRIYFRLHIVENLFVEYQEILENKKKKKEKVENSALGKGGDPSKNSSPFSSYYS